MISLEKTGALVEILRCLCTTCEGDESPIVSDQNIQAERFFKHLGKAAKNVVSIAISKISN